MRTIKLTRGRFALVDDEDYEALNAYRWQYSPRPHTGYAKRPGRRLGSGAREKGVYMHQVVLSPMDGFEIDHINGDGLDNRKCNLRYATKSEQQHNQHCPARSRSGYKGIYQRKDTGKWVARTILAGRAICLGAAYSTAEEAANAAQEGRVLLAATDRGW